MDDSNPPTVLNTNTMDRVTHELATVPFRFVFQILTVIKNALSFVIALQGNEIITDLIDGNRTTTLHQVGAILILVLMIVLVSYIIDYYMTLQSKLLKQPNLKERFTQKYTW